MQGATDKAHASLGEPGGYGKTILAQMVARNQRIYDQYQGEIYWLEIGPE